MTVCFVWHIFHRDVNEYNTLPANILNVEAKIGNVRKCMVSLIFTVVKLCHQTRCPSIDQWIEKMWYASTLGFTQLFRRTLCHFL
jgi:hypothetical protein